jgi:hypothetical protein
MFKKIKNITVMLIGMTLITSCGNNSSSNNNSQEPSIPAATLASPSKLNAQRTNEDITISWESVPNATSYNLYIASFPEQELSSTPIIKNVSSPIRLSNFWGPLQYIRVTALKDNYESKPSEFLSVITRYTIINNTIIRDNYTNLEWQRCALGQNWITESSQCAGIAGRYSTLFALTTYPGTSIDRWRAPTSKELKTLVYCKTNNIIKYIDLTPYCIEPFDYAGVDSYYFPNLSTEYNYLSSTTSAITTDNILTHRQISLYNGVYSENGCSSPPTPCDKNGQHLLLVRDFP